ncbi:MAG: sugar ABC transporter permease [Chloroflexota bacterium]|nr:sugar ABC transporter permease [Chloroflexota bacterium]
MAEVTLPGDAAVPRRRWVSEETRAAWIAISPWAIGFLIFTLGPLIASLYFSFANYNVLQPARWVGLDNYRTLLTDDPLLPKALRNTLIYAVLYVPLHVITALGVALLLNEARQMRGFFRTIFYLPSITPAVATAYLWIWILNPNAGLVNQGLRALNLPAPAWTVDPLWTKPTIVISQLWLLGGAMIIFLAGLKGIPTDLYEAAKLDGAGSWRRFRDVTLPMLSGVTFFVATISTISSLNVFTQGYVMFDKNGGPENSALFVVMYLFKRGFEYFQMGYASAIAWLLFLVIVAITLVQFRLSKRWVYYEAGND